MIIGELVFFSTKGVSVMFRAHQSDVSTSSPIRNRARILVIIQLCLVFWYLIWVGVQPFIGNYWERQSTLTLYRIVFGDANLIADDGSAEAMEQRSRLDQYGLLFDSLPLEQRERLREGYEELVQNKSPSFWEGSLEAFSLFVWGIPPFVQGWLLFSLAVCFLVLFQIDGALLAAWLLPFLSLVFAWDNIQHAPPPRQLPDLALFPTEEFLESQYLEGDIEGSVAEQRELLIKAWRLYLVKEWTSFTPSTDPEIFSKQAEEGEFRFMLKRLELRAATSPPPLYEKLRVQRPLPILFLYVLWNLCFAIALNWKGAVYKEEDA